MRRNKKNLSSYLIIFALLVSPTLKAENLQMADGTDILIHPGLNQATVSQPPSYQHEYVRPENSQNAYTDKPNVDASVAQSMQHFKEWFNLNAENSDQLTEMAAVLIAKYYNQLRQCLTGVYKYPVPNILFGWRINNRVEPKYFLATATIAGIKNERCQVETIISMHHEFAKTRCDYSQSSLNLFTDARARNEANNNISYKKNELSKIQQMSQECQTISENQTTAAASIKIPSSM